MATSRNSNAVFTKMLRGFLHKGSAKRRSSGGFTANGMGRSMANNTRRDIENVVLGGASDLLSDGEIIIATAQKGLFSLFENWFAQSIMRTKTRTQVSESARSQTARLSQSQQAAALTRLAEQGRRNL